MQQAGEQAPRPVASRDNPRLRRVCRLLDDAAFRAAEGCFAAEGGRLCVDIAAAVPPLEVWYTPQGLRRCPAAAALGGTHYLLEGPAAEKLARTRTPQGVWGVFPMPAAALEDLRGPRLLALDAVQDPGNLGAALRSAAAFGWQGALLGPGCADPFGPKALRAAMSSTVKLPLVRTLALEEALAQLARQGWLCLAARLRDSEELPALPAQARCVLVIGSEGQGIRPQVDAVCSRGVRIPISPAMESLNAAVAAGVLMWHYRPQGAHPAVRAVSGE